jgi:hypothetical protein
VGNERGATQRGRTWGVLPQPTGGAPVGSGPQPAVAGGTPGVRIGEAGVTDRWDPGHCNGWRGQTPFESIQIQTVQFNSNISKF